MYAKTVYCVRVHKASLMVNNERNVHGQNITKECTWTEYYIGTSVTKSVSLQRTQNQFTIQVYTKPVSCTSVQKLVYWLIMKGMYMDRTLQRNVHGRNITKVRLC